MKYGTLAALAMFGMASGYGCGGPDSPAAQGNASQGSAVVTPQPAASVAGLYFYHVDTRRGPIVGNWSIHDDGTFFEIGNNGIEIPAGTWTSDGTTISLLEAIPYGNVCHCIAPITQTGFASREAPSADISCTFAALKPNPRSGWYAIKLP